MEYNNKVFVESFPRWTIGGGYNNKIKWKDTIGYNIKVIYENCEYDLKIINYEQENQYITIQYKNYEQYRIKTNSLLRCKLGLYLNNVVIKSPWMIPYFQGGYDEAKLYTIGSHKKIYPRCPICGQIKDKEMSIKTIYSYGIGCICGDGFSYAEKFVSNLLTQLNIAYITQLNKHTFNWCQDYRYDFYIPHINTIIEANGKQHYENNTFVNQGGRALEDEQKNDKLKEQLAKVNFISKYIIIDCRKSEMEYIKEKILKSELCRLFNLSDIDWLQCHEFACSNLVKTVCDMWINGAKGTKEIADNLVISRPTVIEFLKKGAKLNWCTYNSKEEMKKSANNASKLTKRKVEIFKNNTSLGVFESSTELARQSLELFGVKLDNRNITGVCKGKDKTHKGFTFRYVGQ